MTANAVAVPSDKRKRSPRSQWLVPIGLIFLTLIPILAGASRLNQLTGGAAITVHNSRFFDSPIPVVTHIVTVTLFSIVGAFQFVPALRRGRRSWHRLAGRVLIPTGFLVALSGMWMAAFYPHPVGDGPALVVIRLIFGSAMLASLVLAIRAIVRRDFVVHGAWMTRAYAIAVAAGTQAILLIPGSIAFGSTDEASRAVIMGGSWVINLAVAEYVIRRRARRAIARRPASRTLNPAEPLT
jgi:hypothetical protein